MFVAISLYAEAATTFDLDIVLDIAAEDADRIERKFGDDQYWMRKQ